MAQLSFKCCHCVTVCSMPVLLLCSMSILPLGSCQCYPSSNLNATLHSMSMLTYIQCQCYLPCSQRQCCPSFRADVPPSCNVQNKTWQDNGNDSPARHPSRAITSRPFGPPCDVNVGAARNSRHLFSRASRLLSSADTVCDPFILTMSP